MEMWNAVIELLGSNLAVGVIILEAVALVYLFRQYTRAKDELIDAYKEIIPAINKLKETIDLIIKLGGGE